MSKFIKVGATPRVYSGKGPVGGYVDMLNSGTIEASEAEKLSPTRKFNPLRPSSAGKCTRELAYELAEYHGLATYPRETNSAEMTRIFDLGHHVERHLIQQFDKYLDGFDLKYKQQVVTFFPLVAENHPEWNTLIEGSLDACFWSPTSRAVIDFKSKKDRFSSFFKSNWDETAEKLSKMKSVETVSDSFYWVADLPSFLKELKDPFFEMNFVQLNGYACTDFLRSRGVDHASIIQSNKNDSRLREVRFAPSMEVFETTRRKFQAAVDAVDKGDIELAPKDHLLGSLKCKFCPFKKVCWEGQDADRAFYNTLPAKQWPRDTNRMGDSGAVIEEMFHDYRAQSDSESARVRTEEAILKMMKDKGVNKIRLADGQVYEARQLKDSIVLRRSKV